VGAACISPGSKFSFVKVPALAKNKHALFPLEGLLYDNTEFSAYLKMHSDNDSSAGSFWKWREKCF